MSHAARHIPLNQLSADALRAYFGSSVLMVPLPLLSAALSNLRRVIAATFTVARPY